MTIAMKQQKTTDLTEGSPLRLLVTFTIPLLLGFLFQQFYNMVDTIVVGKFLGVEALAGVGSTGAINFLILGFCNGVCAGFAIPVAQHFGRKDDRRLRHTVGNIFWLSLGLASLLTVTVCLLCHRLLIWMHTPPEALPYAHHYILIIFMGIPATILYNILSGIIRSLGDSRTPLFFLIFSSILNIILDLVLIVVIQAGVAGAAIATVISQIVSGVLCLIYMVGRYPILRMCPEDWKIRRQECCSLLSMGLPMGLQYSVTAIGNTILQTSINCLGPAAMAAVTAAGRIKALMACPLDAIGTAAATYTGQNIGAGKLERVNRGVLINFIIGCIYCILPILLTVIWGEQCISLFLDPNSTNRAQILVYGKRYLLCNTVNFTALLCVNLFRFSIQGMGFSGIAVLAGLLELIGRAAIALLLVPNWGFTAVCAADPCAWFLADLFLIPVYFSGIRKHRKALTPWPEANCPEP